MDPRARVPRKFRKPLSGSILPALRQVEVALNLVLSHWNIPRSAILILEELLFRPDLSQPARLADSLHIPRQTTTSQLDALERRGYLRRLPHPTDRRRVSIALTPEGTAVAEGILGEILAFERRIQAAYEGRFDEVRTHVERFSRAVDRAVREHGANRGGQGGRP